MQVKVIRELRIPQIKTHNKPKYKKTTITHTYTLHSRIQKSTKAQKHTHVQWINTKMIIKHTTQQVHKHNLNMSKTCET